MTKKKPAPSPARKVAWNLAANIEWVAVYRAGMFAAVSIVIGMVSWQSNRIINRQDELSKQVGQLSSDIGIEQTKLMGLADDVVKNTQGIHDEEKRLNRTNDRQIEMAKQIAVIESQLGDLRAARR